LDVAQLATEEYSHLTANTRWWDAVQATRNGRAWEDN
jgi:hypothetical protein